MARTAKAAGLAVVVVLVAVAAGVVTRKAEHAVAEATPSTSATPRTVPKPKGTMTYDLMQQVTRSKLYTAGRVPAVSCQLPRARLTSKAALLAYGQVMVDCLQRAWAPLVAKTDMYFDKPALVAYSKKDPTTVCADPPSNTDAFYTSADRAICFEWPQYIESDPGDLTLVDFQYTLSHEYGHHLQAAVGILSMYDMPYVDTTKAAQLEAERRLELQASCLGAAFLGANKRAFGLTGEGFEDWKYLVKHYGDDNGSPKPIRDHGSRKSHGYWSLRAFSSANPASCNTFTASAKLVS